MLARVLSFTIGLLAVSPLFAGRPPSAQEKEIVDWAIRSLVAQQQHDWRDWSSSADRRSVLVANETIAFPPFADDDFAFSYALEALKRKQADIYLQLRATSKVDLSGWTPSPLIRCDGQEEVFPPLLVVAAPTLEASFGGNKLAASVALVIRVTTPVFSKDGQVALIYAETVGSHVNDSSRQFMLLTRKADRPGEWNAMIDTAQLLPPVKSSPEEREISTADRTVMATALKWLVTKRGGFDLVGLADSPPEAAGSSQRQRECEPATSYELPEATLSQLSRRNSDEVVFDPSLFSIPSVRGLAVGDERIWSRPSVLISLPAYDGDVAVLSMTYRTAEESGETTAYLLIMRRAHTGWSVVCVSEQDGFIIS